MLRSLNLVALQLSVRASSAAALGIAVSHLLRLEIPMHAVLTAVLVTDLDPRRTQAVGLPRLVGTVIGAGLGALLCALLPPGTLRVGLGILLAMLLTFALHLKGSAKVAGYVCGIVLLNFGHNPWWYATHRLAETMVGVVMAVLVSFVPKLLRARRERRPFTGEKAPSGRGA
ncbi:MULTISPECIES: aromatic acid exporter family protein [Myxococcaceae]|uniref:FUSC family protein n=1 Tax=Myxococcaceae TaxID=31 RepID=UPI00188E9FD6|nr:MULTISPECIES: FUSC family protein [Myxococcaceae]MBF5043111.1 FUSC family protein [Simulacricoccus sp. 17bor-14]